MPAQVLSGPDLPARVRAMGGTPRALYLHGCLPEAPTVAVVGTRRPTRPALEFASKLAAGLAAQGLCVASGGAEGIDTAAHRGALSVKGATLVVAPAGFERPFPSDNAALFRDVVARGGAYLSLEPDHRPAQRGRFFQRNAVLVALSDVVVIVEAGVRSGARNAAKWARRMHRPLFAVPAAPWSGAGLGCVLELRRGAKPLLNEKDVMKELEALGLGVQRLLDLPAGEPDRGGGADNSLGLVRRAVENGATHADAIVQETGLPAADVHRVLLTLTLDGVLAPDPAGGILFVSRQYR
ncbi:MAG: DNA-processing protein DprA [Polyangiaceae bacterium]